MKFDFLPQRRPSELRPGQSSYLDDHFNESFYQGFRILEDGSQQTRTFAGWDSTRVESWCRGDFVKAIPKDKPPVKRYTLAQKEHYIKHGTTVIENYPDTFPI